MELKKENLRRLASLSALGAGALGATAGTASANDIVFSGVINAEAPYTMLGPNGAGAAFGIIPGCQITCFSFWSGVAIYSNPGKHGTEFRLLATGPRKSYAQGEPQAAIWGTAAGKSTKSADIWFDFDFRGIVTTFNSTDRYLLFRFQGGALKHDMYGWARIQVTTDGRVDIVDWAYDPSGVRLPDGYHGTGQTDQEDAGTVEPSAFNATGLPALALGSLGVRKWRAARIAGGEK